MSNDYEKSKNYPEVTLKELMEGMNMSDFREKNEKMREQSILAERNEKKREKVKRCLQFLKWYTPIRVEKKLNEYVVGQPELVKAVADFLYYHALRQLYPQLPVRNLLIAGSSGSGKTEVFRRAKELFGYMINIRIVDGCRITKEGWSGSQKLEGLLSPDLDILVIDEADKLCTPSYTSGGGNVSKEIQSEFLKLMEGEYEVNERRKPSYILDGVSVVFVGAFESIREKQKLESSRTFIGFGNVALESKKQKQDITDDELINFGVLPELLGRIAVKVVTNDLSDEDYLQILKNPHGRVETLLTVLTACGMSAEQVLSDEEILDMIGKSKENRTGFRWVSAQVENQILETIRENGVTIDEEVFEAMFSMFQEPDEEDDFFGMEDDFFGEEAS